MDYEKKYKELVGKIEKAYLYAQTDSTKAVLEEIRPELAESEDERIRKEILEFVTIVADSKSNKMEWISWLEKQGEKKSIFDFNANNWYVSKVDGKIHNIYNSGVEPKFHEGTTITIPKDLKGTDTDGGVVGEKGEQGETPFKEHMENLKKRIEDNQLGCIVQRLDKIIELLQAAILILP